MKKIIMLIGLMLFFISGLFAQAGETYYYKYVETVNPNSGIRSYSRPDLYFALPDGFDGYTNAETKEKGIYITFTRNSCYISDSKGILLKAKPNGYPSRIYSYQGEKKDRYVFTRDASLYVMGSRIGGEYIEYFYFSKDYKRLNVQTYDGEDDRWWDHIDVFEKADPPKNKKGDAPDFLY